MGVYAAVLLLALISGSLSYNILLITVGHAGHVIPLFELAKGLKDHNITFVTDQVARAYVNFPSFPNPSSFRVVYGNDSAEAFEAEKDKERQLIAHAANHSFFDSMGFNGDLLGAGMRAMLTKTVELLMHEHYDLLISNSVMKPVQVLCKQAKIPCVIQTTEFNPLSLDFNLPNIFSSLTRKQMSQFKYRIYNVLFSLRVIAVMTTKLIPSVMSMSKFLPSVPGPFKDSFTMSNLLNSQTNSLELFSLPPTFYTLSHPHHYAKYLGAFIDETSAEVAKSELTEWIETKPDRAIIYGAFGTSSLIQRDRMSNLIHGLAEFLLKNFDSFLVLVLRGSNHDAYQQAFNEMKNEAYRRVLTDHHRVRIENRFVPQKWILQQKSVKLFLSHCGMGSCSEGIYFQKPILCMPFNMDQFINALSIDQSAVGLSLFVPPSLFESLLKPHHFHQYTFTPDSVTTKLSEMWTNELIDKAVQIMSLEMKHAGGTKRAVEEIEFFMKLDGNLDRYAPFQSTLPFYQRYQLDILLVFVVLPIIVFRRCCKRSRKEKKD